MLLLKSLIPDLDKNPFEMGRTFESCCIPSQAHVSRSSTSKWADRRFLPAHNDFVVTQCGILEKKYRRRFGLPLVSANERRPVKPLAESTESISCPNLIIPVLHRRRDTLHDNVQESLVMLFAQKWWDRGFVKPWAQCPGLGESPPIKTKIHAEFGGV